MTITAAPRRERVADAGQRRADARVVGDAPPSSCGTLRSARMKTRCPASGESANRMKAMRRIEAALQYRAHERVSDALAVARADVKRSSVRRVHGDRCRRSGTTGGRAPAARSALSSSSVRLAVVMKRNGKTRAPSRRGRRASCARRTERENAVLRVGLADGRGMRGEDVGHCVSASGFRLSRRHQRDGRVEHAVRKAPLVVVPATTP